MIYKLYMDNCPPCNVLNKNLEHSKFNEYVVPIKVSSREGLELVKKYKLRGAPALIINDTAITKDELAKVGDHVQLDEVISGVLV